MLPDKRGDRKGCHGSSERAAENGGTQDACPVCGPLTPYLRIRHIRRDPWWIEYPFVYPVANCKETVAHGNYAGETQQRDQRIGLIVLDPSSRPDLAVQIEQRRNVAVGSQKAVPNERQVIVVVTRIVRKEERSECNNANRTKS